MSGAVARAMREEAVRAFPFETGGVLLGYWAREYEEVVVTHATGPGPRAVHRMHSFVPDAEYQEAEVARLYEESGRVSTYLGDWHSHPLGTVSLSRRDRRTLRHIAGHREARAPVPIMAVIGGGDPDWFLGVWRFAPIRLGVILLRSGIVSMEPRFFDEK
jgi:integrative and conjugative element protein (TIGR02256 family)